MNGRQQKKNTATIDQLFLHRAMLHTVAHGALMKIAVDESAQRKSLNGKFSVIDGFWKLFDFEEQPLVRVRKIDTKNCEEKHEKKRVDEIYFRHTTMDEFGIFCT